MFSYVICGYRMFHCVYLLLHRLFGYHKSKLDVPRAGWEASGAVYRLSRPPYDSHSTASMINETPLTYIMLCVLSVIDWGLQRVLSVKCVNLSKYKNIHTIFFRENLTIFFYTIFGSCFVADNSEQYCSGLSQRVLGGTQNPLSAEIL